MSLGYDILAAVLKGNLIRNSMAVGAVAGRIEETDDVVIIHPKLVQSFGPQAVDQIDSMIRDHFDLLISQREGLFLFRPWVVSEFVGTGCVGWDVGVGK